MTLAQRVRDQRYARGWGPEELASRAEISRTALYQIESGRTETPRAATLQRIAQALEVSTETLLGPHLGVVAMGWGGPSSSPPSVSLASPRPEEIIPVSSRFRFDDESNHARNGDLDRKFHEVLASPLGEGLARIIEESHRLLPRKFAEASR